MWPNSRSPVLWHIYQIWSKFDVSNYRASDKSGQNSRFPILWCIIQIWSKF